MTVRPLWQCPECGRRFANKNQWHGCGPYTVETFLAGKGERARLLFERFAGLVAECGPYDFAPAKTRIGFQVRTIFAAVNGLRDDRLDVHLLLPRRLSSPRVHRIESPSAKTHVHHFRFRDLSELDGEIRGWLCEAYQLAG